MQVGSFATVRSQHGLEVKTGLRTHIKVQNNVAPMIWVQHVMLYFDLVHLSEEML
jgi:hypothetical protein